MESDTGEVREVGPSGGHGSAFVAAARRFVLDALAERGESVYAFSSRSSIPSRTVYRFLGPDGESHRIPAHTIATMVCECAGEIRIEKKAREEDDEGSETGNESGESV